MFRLKRLFSTFGLGVILTQTPMYCAPQISGLFDFQYKDGQKATNIGSTYSHQGSPTFSVGQMTLFIDGDINDTMFYTGEVQSDLLSPDAEQRGFNVRTASVTMTNLWKWKPNIQFGKFDTIFGEYTNRRLPFDNPLFDAPLAYSHKLSLDPDGGYVPNNLKHTINDIREISLINREMTQTGVKVFGHLRDSKLNYAYAMTNNPISNNKTVNINNGLSHSFKLHWIADEDANFGFCYSTGGWMDSLDKVSLTPRYDANYMTLLAKPNPSKYQNNAFNLYMNYRFQRFDFQSEFMSSTFEVPNLNQDLTAQSFFVEGKYHFTKDLFGAFRYDTIAFNSDKYILPNNTNALKWDEDATRIEAGVGNFINANTLAKITLQSTDYDGGTAKDFDLMAGSISVAF